MLQGLLVIDLQTGQASGAAEALAASPSGVQVDQQSGQATGLVPATSGAVHACAPCADECGAVGAGIVMQGVPGPAGPESLPGFNSIAAVTLSALHVVYRAADGLRYASSDAPSTAVQAVGVLPAAINAGALGFVQTSEEITDASWAWSLGPVWLGLNGALTQTPISSGAQVEVGIAIASNTLLIRVQPSILIQ